MHNMHIRYIYIVVCMCVYSVVSFHKYNSFLYIYIYLIQYQTINDGVAIEWRNLVISTVFVRSLFITVLITID